MESPPKNKGGAQKFRRMQQIHGLTPGKACGDCKYFMRFGRPGRQYFKCKVWRTTGSAATDIRKSDQACGLWDGGVPDGSSKDK